MVRSVDSSLVDEWAAAGDTAALDIAPPSGADTVVADRRGMTLLVRNALFHRVRLAALQRAGELGELDGEWGMGEVRWQHVLDAFFDAHEELLLDATRARRRTSASMNATSRQSMCARAPDLP